MHAIAPLPPAAFSVDLSAPGGCVDRAAADSPGWVAVERRRSRRWAGRLIRRQGAARSGTRGLMPGLVNAHTHLELSWLRGRVPPAATFIDWISSCSSCAAAGVERRRRQQGHSTPRVQARARDARASAPAPSATSATRWRRSSRFARRGLRGVVFHELLGFNAADRPIGRWNAARIAPRPRRLGGRRRARGAGPARAVLGVARTVSCDSRGSRCASRCHHQRAPGRVGRAKSNSSATAAGHGRAFSNGRVARATTGSSGHGTGRVSRCLGVLDAGRLSCMACSWPTPIWRGWRAIGATLVTCPRSNQWVGVGVPPIERFYASGVQVAVGTDSLASVDDLESVHRVQTMRWLAPSVPARHAARERDA